MTGYVFVNHKAPCPLICICSGISTSAASVTGMDLNKMTLKMIFFMKPGQPSVTGYVCVDDKAHVHICVAAIVSEDLRLQ